MTAVVVDRTRVPASNVAALAEQGWSEAEGFDLPARPFDLADRRWVRWGPVPDDATAAQVVLAAVRGVRVVAGCPDVTRREVLLGDLRRVGDVRAVELGPDPVEVLDHDQRALLEHLADGDSIGVAAERLHLSARTAERRLASARKQMGVRTTAEAIALASG